MKFKHLFLVATLALLGFAACEPEEKDLGAPAATLSTQSVTIAQAGGTATVDVSATRGWTLSTDADWIGYNPTSGKASEDATAITITVAANTEYDRTGEIYFEVGEGLITKVITVTQPGLKHKETHTGTVDSPYTVEEALEIINAGTYTDAEVYVKGIISSIDTEKDPPGNSYGNATYWISDDGTDAVQLEVYRGYGVGGERMKSADYIKVGDEVIVCGVLVMFKSTPEITQGSSIYSLNGRTSGGGGDTEEPKVVTVAEFIAAADSKTQPYQLTGTIGGSINTQYGNFDLSDGTGTIYVFGMTSTNLGYGAQNDQSYASLGLKSGDNITLIGFRDTYNGKNECVYSYFVKKNSSGPDIPDDPGTPSGSGTAEDPFNVAAVRAYTIALGADVTSENQVYAKGKISSIKNAYDASYGTAVYNISDDGTTNEFTVYSSYYFDNKSWVNGNMQIKVGDEVVVCGKVVYYQGQVPEFASKQSWLVSLNGATSDEGGQGGGDDPVDPGSSVSFNLNSSAQTWSAASDGTYGDGFSATTQGVKTAYYKYNSSSEPVAPSADHIRIYKNSAFVVTAPEGKTISKIVITATAADKCVDMPEIGASSTASADTSAKTITWSGTAKNQVVLSAENGQVRAKSIAITFSE